MLNFPQKTITACFYSGHPCLYKTMLLFMVEKVSMMQELLPMPNNRLLILIIGILPMGVLKSIRFRLLMILAEQDLSKEQESMPKGKRFLFLLYPNRFMNLLAGKLRQAEV